MAQIDYVYAAGFWSTAELQLQYEWHQQSYLDAAANPVVLTAQLSHRTGFAANDAFPVGGEI